jgi:murein DD-endopeptidase MepM/ murein hydrolase activator NlpD
VKRLFIFKYFLGLFLIATIVVMPSFIFAQSDTTQAQLDATLKAKADLEAQLKEDQAKLDAVSAQKNTLSKTVNELDLTGKKLNTEVSLTQSKINQVGDNISKLNSTIVDRQTRIANFKKTIGQNIKNLDEMDRQSFIVLALSKESITDVIKQREEEQIFNQKMGDSIKAMMAETENLNKDKNDRELKKQDLESYKGEVLVQKDQVDANKKDKTTLLTQTKAQEAAYQKIIDEKLKLQAQFDNDLAALEAKIKFNLDPNSYPKPKNGILAWPRDYVLITQSFGLTESSWNLYQYRTGAWKGKHAGVDFRANNDRVLAMADGVVVDTGNTDIVCPRASMGNWILLQHDNGLDSTYFHLSQILVKKGQRVKVGDLIGYSGNTGYSTAPHLHIGVMPTGAVSIQTWPSAGCKGKNYTTPVVANSFYLNPLDYLPVASSNMFKAGNSD